MRTTLPRGRGPDGWSPGRPRPRGRHERSREEPLGQGDALGEADLGVGALDVLDLDAEGAAVPEGGPHLLRHVPDDHHDLADPEVVPEELHVAVQDRLPADLEEHLGHPGGGRPGADAFAGGGDETEVEHGVEAGPSIALRARASPPHVAARWRREADDGEPPAWPAGRTWSTSARGVGRAPSGAHPGG